MGWLERFFRKPREESGTPWGLRVYDLRNDAARELERRAHYALKSEDERIAHTLVSLIRQLYASSDAARDDWHAGRAPNPHENPEAVKRDAELSSEIRRIGEQIGANGGDPRMQLIGYRVTAIGLREGITSRILELKWRDICGWQP